MKLSQLIDLSPAKAIAAPATVHLCPFCGKEPVWGEGQTCKDCAWALETAPVEDKDAD